MREKITKDMTNEICTKCNKGEFQETSLLDDLKGVLHCTFCKTEIERYQTIYNEN